MGAVWRERAEKGRIFGRFGQKEGTKVRSGEGCNLWLTKRTRRLVAKNRPPGYHLENEFGIGALFRPLGEFLCQQRQRNQSAAGGSAQKSAAPLLALLSAAHPRPPFAGVFETKSERSSRRGQRPGLMSDLRPLPLCPGQNDLACWRAKARLMRWGGFGAAVVGFGSPGVGRMGQNTPTNGALFP